eukprot:scaffold10945_cov62-Phaeocystis_antarctica.AAC.7
MYTYKRAGGARRCRREAPTYDVKRAVESPASNPLCGAYLLSGAAGYLINKLTHKKKPYAQPASASRGGACAGDVCCVCALCPLMSGKECACDNECCDGGGPRPRDRGRGGGGARAAGRGALRLRFSMILLYLLDVNNN